MWEIEVIRFAVAATIAAVVNLSALYLASDILGIPYVIGSAIAFIAGFIVAFALHKWWTFREHSRARVPRQIALSILLNLVNFATYVGLIYFLVEWLAWWHLYAAIIGGLAIPIENFLAFKFLIFRRSEAQ